MENTKNKNIIFNSVEVIEKDDVYLYIINDLSEELKNYIRKKFVFICTGDTENKYQSVLKDFIQRINKNDKENKKNQSHLKGIIGELLAHIFIENSSINLNKISALFNLEERASKKSFDIIMTNNDENNLWFTEVKSGSLDKDHKTSDKKNISLINNSKKDLVDKFNSKDKSIWYNAINHAKVIIDSKNNSNSLKILRSIYHEDIKVDSYKNAILSSVLFNDINDTINIDSILNKKEEIKNQKIFNKLIIFSIQKNTYYKVINFLEKELNDNIEYENINTEKNINQLSNKTYEINLLNNEDFIKLYVKLLQNNINYNKDIFILLIFSIIFINSKNNKLIKLGYRIIVKYSNLFNDYIPLYDIAINLNYIPICHFIEQMDKYKKEFNERFNNILMSSYCNLFKESKHIYFTGKQKELKEYFIKNKYNDTLVIAPTSYGKSELILSLIEDFDKIVIVVPIKSLITQQKNKLRKHLKNKAIDIFDNIDSFKSKDKYICVLTQERLEKFINKNIIFDIAFIDEAHNLLSSDTRALILAECIIKLKHNNTILKFFTPFIKEPKNLTFDNEIISFEKNKSNYFYIEENIKSENYYNIDFTNENPTLKLYDNYFYDFINIKSLSNIDYINFILEYSNDKNLIYINSTKNILSFVNKFYNRIDNKIVDEKVNKYIIAISNYISNDFILNKCIEKGIIFHFGNLPDNIKIYIEQIYKENIFIKFIITSSTLLEGINIPIYNIFMLERFIGNKKLNSSQFKNLVGRACRLNDIFDYRQNNLKLLEPNIYNIKILKNDNDKLDDFIKIVLNEDVKDIVKNPHLKYGINKKEYERIKEKIENTNSDFILSKDLFNYNIYSNINIDEFDKINEAAIKVKNNLNKENIKINDFCELLNATKKIFYNNKNNRLKILSYKNSINLLNDIIRDRIDSNYKQRIISFKKSIKEEKNITANKLLYVGTKFGNTKLTNNKNTNEFINIYKIDNSMAFFLLQEFDNEIDFNLQIYFDLMYSYGIVEEELINKIKYRTTNKNKIKIIDNGISFTLADILVDEKYSKFYSVENNEIKNDIVEEMIKNNENDIIVFEMRNYLGTI